MNQVLLDHTGSADQRHHSCSGSEPCIKVLTFLRPSRRREMELQADLLQLIKTALIRDERSDDITAEADN